jgi:hypothetical protein
MQHKVHKVKMQLQLVMLQAIIISNQERLLSVRQQVTNLKE